MGKGEPVMYWMFVGMWLCYAVIKFIVTYPFKFRKYREMFWS